MSVHWLLVSVEGGGEGWGRGGEVKGGGESGSEEGACRKV